MLYTWEVLLSPLTSAQDSRAAIQLRSRRTRVCALAPQLRRAAGRRAEPPQRPAAPPPAAASSADAVRVTVAAVLARAESHWNAAQ